MDIILASRSKYKINLMGRLHVKFRSISSDLDETTLKKLALKPYALTMELARAKAMVLQKEHSRSVIIATDQIISIGEKIFDKPENFERASEQLRELQGKVHDLVTSTTIIHPTEENISFTNTTHLKMRTLQMREIVHYLKKDQPFDCAGSYRIEALGISLFETIKTNDFTSIIGLPLLQLSKCLRNYGLMTS